MHPILFRIPLDKLSRLVGPLKLWWALAAVTAIALVYVALGLRRKDRTSAGIAAVIGVAAAGVAWKFKHVESTAPNLPIYSYGVMLGVSLVVGWYLTLTLAERDGLPKETMANCYVITALAAIAGSRILYFVTNLDEFKNMESPEHEILWTSIFQLRRGGLVAYGGFLGGYIGSWLYLRLYKIRLMPWADVAVPSLASGLLITRIGCYLFGCDFGKRLSDGAPGWLKKLGTFPEWAQGTLDGGGGSPAFARHLKVFDGTTTATQIRAAHASLPVHPTQIYESLVGLFLLGLLLWQRKNQKFRGQIFFLFAFAYGYLRFLLETLRDDVERGEFGPTLAEHWFVGGSLLILAIAFAFGVSLGVKDPRVRMVVRVLAFVPPVAVFVMLRPASFGKETVLQLSTSQWIGLLSAALVAFFYAKFWEEARKAPKLAMSRATLGDFDDDIDEPRKKKDAADTAADGSAKKSKGGSAKPETTAAASEASEDEDEDEDDEDDADDDEPANTDNVETQQAPEVAPNEDKKGKSKDTTGSESA